MISDEAVEAAMRSIYSKPGVVTESDVRTALEAAAPYMLAEAYEADAKAFRSCKSRNPFEWHVSRVMASLFESRAARIRSRA